MKGPGFWKHGGAWGGGSFHKNYTGSGRGPAAPSVDCPESGCEVCLSTCLKCENYNHWHEQDEVRRCYHEFLDLESRGYYDGTWNDQPGQYTYEEWVQYQEELRRDDLIDSEMEREWAEFEREDEEFERRAEEMERKADSDYDEYLKGEYGDHEEEEDDYDDEQNDHEKENGKEEEDVEEDYDEEEDEDEDEYGEEDYCDDDQEDGYDYGDGWRG